MDIYKKIKESWVFFPLQGERERQRAKNTLKNSSHTSLTSGSLSGIGGDSCVGGGGVMARGGATGTTFLLLSFDSSRIRSEYVACYKKDEERKESISSGGGC